MARFEPDHNIFFVGINIDARKSSRLERAGELERVMSGVYVRAGLADVADVVAKHAARIVAKTYPGANLCYASAECTGAVGRYVFLGGAYKKVTETKYLDFIQSVSPSGSEMMHRWATVTDSLGQVQVMVASPELTFLQMFERVNKYPQKRVSDPVLLRMGQDLLASHGGNESEVVRRLKYVAKEMGIMNCYAEASGYILKLASASEHPVANQKRMADLKVYWNHRHVADLSHNGLEWAFSYKPGWALPLSIYELSRSKRLPPFIEALMPEHGNPDGDAGAGQDISLIKSGVKYLSNICITPDPEQMKATPVDILDGKLADFSSKGVFTGKLSKVKPGSVASRFNESMREIWESRPIPRISGIVAKIPMTLDSKGHLFPAVDTAFTHILKLPGVGDWELLGGLEWYCLEVARMAGIDVAKSALIFPSDGSAPAVISERFDIRTGPDDRRMIVSEDFCSVLGQPPSSKYQGQMETVAKRVKELSTDKERDCEELYRQVIAAWIMANGDFHLKNLSFLKVAAPTLDSFETVKLSPAYDMLCTRIFPGFQNDGFALPVNGETHDISREDFLQFARVLDIKSARANAILEEFSYAMASAAIGRLMRLPDGLKDFPRVSDAIKRSAEIMVVRSAGLLKMTPKALAQEIADNAVRPAAAPVKRPAPIKMR